MRQTPTVLHNRVSLQRCSSELLAAQASPAHLALRASPTFMHAVALTIGSLSLRTDLLCISDVADFAQSSQYSHKVRLAKCRGRGRSAAFTLGALHLASIVLVMALRSLSLLRHGAARSVQMWTRSVRFSASRLKDIEDNPFYDKYKSKLEKVQV